MFYLKVIGPAVVLVGDLTVAAASGVGNATFLQLAIAIAGSGLLASWWAGRARAKSGEDRSAAAEDVAHAASEMAGAVTDLTQPLREENARLHGRLQSLQERLTAKTESLADTAIQLAQCEAAFEKRRHQDAQELATLAAEVVTLQIKLEHREKEIEKLEVLAGIVEDRREAERRDSVDRVAKLEQRADASETRADDAQAKAEDAKVVADEQAHRNDDTPGHA